jgi:hypothetical protein
VGDDGGHWNNWSERNDLSRGRRGSLIHIYLYLHKGIPSNLSEVHAIGNMFDWENDEFLSSWDRTYVSTNVKIGCTPFDLGTFSALMDNLNQAGPDISSISYCIIVRAIHFS